MTQLTDIPDAVDSTHQRTTLARITGLAGLVTLVVVLGSSLANYQSASFTSDADETVTFFRSIDDAFGAFSSFATAVGLIAMLWFALGLALLLRQYDGPLPWRSTFLAGQLKDLAESKRQLEELIETINGVGQVRFVGERQRQIQVVLDGERLYAYNLNIDSIRQQLAVLPPSTLRM